MQSGKAHYNKFRSYRRGSETNLNFQPVNKPSWISPHEVLKLRLINIIYHLLVNNNNNNIKGEGGGLFNFVPLKREGGLNRGFVVQKNETKQTNKQTNCLS